MEFFENKFFESNWFIYGILLMVCIPLIVVVINEVSYLAKKKNKQLSAPLNTFKNIILPLIAISLVFTQVL